MVLKRFYNDKLAQASYLIGCPVAGEAVIVDPNRDIEPYIRAAEEEGVSITAVTETHIHADYLSGSRELAAVTGAQLYLSGEGDETWKYDFAQESGAKLLKGGDSIRVGVIRIDVLKSPGHTPEHISFVITDEASSMEPMGFFSGDFVFVGDVGRPDLMETAAGFAGTMESSARELFRSIQSLASYPPHLMVWPGHGAGSACGKALGAVPVTSLGYERLTNWALKAHSEDLFTHEVLSGQPEPPLYFAQMKKLNKEGPPLLGGFKVPQRRQDEERIGEMIEKGAVVIDLREPEAYMAKHVPGTLLIPQYRSFITWAGSIVPYGRDIYLIGHSEVQIEEAIRDLALIGLDQVVGWYGEQALDHSGPLETTDQVHAKDLLTPSPNSTVVDVRSHMEWETGHVANAVHLPLATLAKRAMELPKDQRLMVHCQGGVRSTVAVSLLKKMGFKNVTNVIEGYDGYIEAQNQSELQRFSPV